MSRNTIQYLPISEIKPYPHNPRKNEEAVVFVANSIEQFGFKSPIIIDKNNVIVCGHTRLLAAEKLGLNDVPCIVADDLTPEQIKAYRLADNMTASKSEWDVELLQTELLDLEANFDMADFGFEIAPPTGYLPEDDDFDADAAAEAITEPTTKLGDIWQLGRHRLMCGDSMDKAAVGALMDGNKADMVFTDPPYELDTKGGGVLKSANSMKQISDNGVDTFDPSMLEMYCKTNVFFHNKPLIKKYIELAEKNGMPFDLCFYKKMNTAPNYGGHMMTDCEYIAIIGAQSPNRGLPKETYSKCYIGQKDSGNDLSYSKPVELCAKYIKLYSNKAVLDLFGGSGSTLIACEQLNRTCYMMELDCKYSDVIVNRYINLKGNASDVYLERDGTRKPYSEVC